MKRALFALLCLAVLAAPSAAAPFAAPARPMAAISLSSTYSENFDGLLNSGTGNAWADDSTLAGWYATRAIYTAGTGSSTTGALYSFGSSGSSERALGSIASNSTGAIYYGARFVNDTGASMSSITVGYTGEQWRDGGNTPQQKLIFEYQVDATSLANGTWSPVPALDFTGPIASTTAGALDGNASANRTIIAPVTIDLTLAVGQEVWLRWTDANDSGSDHGLAIDDLSVSAATGGNAAIIPVCPAGLNVVAGNSRSGPVSASDSDGTVVSAAITSGDATGITLDGVTPAGAVGGTLSGTLNVGPSTALGSYNVVITFTNDDAPTPQTAACTAPVMVSDGICPAAAITGIAAIQGSGATTPIPGTAVTIRGRVVGDFQGATGMNGFYVQDGGDGDALTSDGIFVYAPGAIDVIPGDAVQVTGAATEYMGVTELSSVTAVTLCGNPPTIAPTDISLPEATDGDLERYEGMLVRLAQTLTVSQNYFQGRDGQVTLSSDGRMFLPLNGNGLGDTADLNARRTLILDDGRVGSANENPNPLPYAGAEDTLRAGDTVTGLTGVIDYGPIDHNSPQTSDYRLQPTQPVSFTRANARTAAPDPVGGNIRVASANVLNYFTTIDPNTGALGYICGPAHDQECRGADSAAELTRQRTKILAELQAINADVFGLMEIENTDDTAVADLASGLNDALGAGTYTYVVEPAPGNDAIKVAMLYKPGVVTPVGPAINYQTSDPTYGAELFDRPPLAQAFSVVATGEKLTVVVNHFKSKGSCPASGVDLDYGQGCWNAKRVAQAAGLLDFIAALQASTGDPDVLVIGDLNAYGIEDPINTLVAGGLVNEVAQIPAAQRYSYVFDGQSGYLDQGLATPSLDAQVNGVTIWHINADEPSVIDYNLNFKPPSPDLYTPTPYRASDHDPVIVGLNLCQAVAASAELGIARSGTNDVILTWPALPNAATYSVWRGASPYFTPAGSPVSTAGTSPYVDGGRTGDATTNYYYVITAVNACDQASPISNRVGEFDFALTPGQ